MSEALDTARAIAARMGEFDRRMSGLEADDPRFEETWNSTWRPLIETHCHTDVAVRSHLSGVEGGREYVGVEGLREYARDIAAQMASLERTPDEFEEVREGVVVMHQLAVMIGRASGARIETDVWTVWRFEDGLLKSSDTHRSREAAYEAATMLTPP